METCLTSTFDVTDTLHLWLDIQSPLYAPRHSVEVKRLHQIVRRS
jgi:hypothetical protein